MDCFVASAFALRASADESLLAMTTLLLFDRSNQKCCGHASLRSNPL